MKKPSQHQLGEFTLFAFPACLPLILSVIAVFALKTPLNDPFLVLLLLFNAAVLFSAVLLVKKCWWISLPMLALGIFIGMQYDQHIPLQPFGWWLVLHYAAWGLYAYKTRRALSQREENLLFFCGVSTVFMFFLILYPL